MDKPILFYDIGELGWSLPLSAHIYFLAMNDIKVAMCTTKDRFPLYNGVKVELIELPDELKNKFGDLDKDGTHLFSHRLNQRVTNRILWPDFHKYFGKQYIVSQMHGYFFGRREFYRYNSSEKAAITVRNMFGDRSIIFIFPRYRHNKFGRRNLSQQFYLSLCNKLCETYSMHTVVSIGSKAESYFLHDDIEYDNFYDLTAWDDDQTLDLFIAMCNNLKIEFAVGSQSALPKMALILNIPTFIIGHEEKRHVEDENWMNTKVCFYKIGFGSKGCYIIEDENDCIKKIIEFGNIAQPIALDNDIDEDEEYHVVVEKYLRQEPLLFYDVGEIGWTQYIVAYIRELVHRGPWERKIIVVTSKDKYVFYRDCCDEIIELPDRITDKLEGFNPDQYYVRHHEKKLRITGKKLTRMFEEIFVQCEVFADYDYIRSRKTESKFFRPYISNAFARDYVEDLCSDSKAIIVFPRKRGGLQASRNLSEEFYINICNFLYDTIHEDIFIVTIGSRKEAYSLVSDVDSINLVGYDNEMTLDILVAFANLRKAWFTVGPQSGPSKVALLCGIPSFVIGHERRRHVQEENWAGTYVDFFDAEKTDDGYVFDESQCLTKLSQFSNNVIKGGKRWI